MADVKSHHRKELTEFELQEVQKYKEICAFYLMSFTFLRIECDLIFAGYLGLGKQRRKTMKMRKMRDENDDGMYAAVCFGSFGTILSSVFQKYLFSRIRLFILSVNVSIYPSTLTSDLLFYVLEK